MRELTKIVVNGGKRVDFLVIIHRSRKANILSIKS